MSTFCDVIILPGQRRGAGGAAPRAGGQGRESGLGCLPARSPTTTSLWAQSLNPRSCAADSTCNVFCVAMSGSMPSIGASLFFIVVMFHCSFHVFYPIRPGGPGRAFLKQPPKVACLVLGPNSPKGACLVLGPIS